MFALRKDYRVINSSLLGQIRSVQTNDSLVDNCENVKNKNPRNLELLRIARKPVGFRLDNLKQEFWHKIEVTKHQRYIHAEILHHENGAVIFASTKEWGFKKKLYSLTDATAYMNLGRVIARRCLESGIYAVRSDLEVDNSEKLSLLVEEAQKEGLKFEEPPRYNHHTPQSSYRNEKPWEVIE